MQRVCIRHTSLCMLNVGTFLEHGQASDPTQMPNGSDLGTYCKYILAQIRDCPRPIPLLSAKVRFFDLEA
jgi:hypothetical protein